jgi:hypothetical protein
MLHYREQIIPAGSHFYQRERTKLTNCNYDYYRVDVEMIEPIYTPT